MDLQKTSFDNWTMYDDWLIQNYDKYAVIKLNEIDGKVVAEYCTKEDYDIMIKTQSK